LAVRTLHVFAENAMSACLLLWGLNVTKWGVAERVGHAGGVLKTLKAVLSAQEARNLDREAADQALLNAKARLAWVEGCSLVNGAYYYTGTGNVRRIVELDGRDVTYEDRCGRSKCLLQVFIRGVSSPV
jgi:hypothetical protein